MINVNIKSAVSEEDVTDSKQKFNLNDVLNGTVVLSFEEELCVLREAVKNIREIHKDFKEKSDENPFQKGTFQFSALIWHIILNKVYNKAINLLTKQIWQIVDDNKRSEYLSVLKSCIETLERSEKVLDNLTKEHADIMWFGID